MGRRGLSETWVPWALAGLALVVPFCSGPAVAAAGCEFDPEAAKRTDVFARHLDRSCTPADRERLAIQASEILGALTKGKGIDLVGVVVQGDLGLDSLSLRSTFQLKGLPQALPDLLQGVSSVRVVSGPFTLRDTVVRGRLATNDADEALVIQGPVIMTGTTFEQSVDLSRVVFLGPVDFSTATLLREGFFVQSRFTQAVRFAHTVFGSHTRFHRARFEQSVTFQHARFNGLAEFLEVLFDKDVDLSDATYGSGTGFSGSRFRSRADVSKAVFEREAYFLFAEFEGPVSFHRAIFKSVADFSDAKFRQPATFSATRFVQRPHFERVVFPPGQTAPPDNEDSSLQFGITLILLIVAALLVVYMVRLK